MDKKILSEVSRIREMMGIINESIEDILTKGKVLKKGSSGEDVKELQRILKLLKYNLGTSGPKKDGIDGNFGNATHNKVVDFQSKNGLKPDGVVGKRTISKMIEKGESSAGSSFWDTLTTNPENILALIKSNTGLNSDSSKPVKDHFVFYFSFPQYEPRYDGSAGWFEQGLDYIRNISPESFSSVFGKKGTYGPMGHAGVALINNSGKIDIYEFGRYEGAGMAMGITKHKSIQGAKIVNGNISNLETVACSIKNNAQGQAKEYRLEGVAIPITKEGYDKGIQKAKLVTKKPYEIFDFDTGDMDANCATFGLEVLRTATGSGSEYCLPNPGAGLKVASSYRNSKSTSC
jgi:hypothetical protein